MSGGTNTRRFLVVYHWAWDKGHNQYATFEIEETPEEPFYGQPLAHELIREYIQTHDYIRRIISETIQAADGSIMGHATPLALFEIDTLQAANIGEIRVEEEVRKKDFKFTLDLQGRWLCDIDKNCNLVLE